MKIKIDNFEYNVPKNYKVVGIISESLNNKRYNVATQTRETIRDFAYSMYSEFREAVVSIINKTHSSKVKISNSEKPTRSSHN